MAGLSVRPTERAWCTAVVLGGLWTVALGNGALAQATATPDLAAIPHAEVEFARPDGLPWDRFAEAAQPAPTEAPSAPSGTPTEPGTLDKARQAAGKAVAAAQEVKKSFEQLLLGQSVTVGVARVFPEAVLHDPDNPGVKTEDYTGPGLYAPAFTFSSASASGDNVVGGRIGRLHILWSLNFQANYAQFNADSQTVQKLAGGASPNGYVRGDFVYGVGLLAHNYTYEGESINWGRESPSESAQDSPNSTANWITRSAGRIIPKPSVTDTTSSCSPNWR